jgi:hypothetical protein
MDPLCLENTWRHLRTILKKASDLSSSVEEKANRRHDRK